MKAMKCRKITIFSGLNGFLKNREVVGVSEEVAVVEHVDPDLPVGNDFRTIV